MEAPVSRSPTTRRRAPKTPRRSTPWTAYAFGLGGLVVLSLAGFVALAPVRTARPLPPAVAASQQVVVSMAGYSPARLMAKAGEDLTVTFINPDSRFHTDGGGWHQFRIEALGVDVRIPPSSRQTVTLRDLRAGTYEFYCDVCCGGKENPAMRGILEVTG